MSKREPTIVNNGQQWSTRVNVGQRGQRKSKRDHKSVRVSTIELES